MAGDVKLWRGLDVHAWERFDTPLRDRYILTLSRSGWGPWKLVTATQFWDDQAATIQERTALRQGSGQLQQHVLSKLGFHHSERTRSVAGCLSGRE